MERNIHKIIDVNKNMLAKAIIVLIGIIVFYSIQG
jgi:hypothetical protein